MTRIAVLDDWQDAARASADWSALQARAEIVFFHRALGSVDEVATALADFDIVLSMRERTPFPAALAQRLPKLRMLGMTGSRAASIDIGALTTQGVVVCTTGGEKSGIATAELALGLMLATVRRIAAGDASIRAGRFQEGVGMGPLLEGKTLGLIGVGRIGSRMARYGEALGMQVLGWSSEPDGREGGRGRRAADDETGAAGPSGRGLAPSRAVGPHARDYRGRGTDADEARRRAGEHRPRSARR